MQTRPIASHCRLACRLIVAACWLSALLHANVLYETSFESFTAGTGKWAGTDGWTLNTSSSISSAANCHAIDTDIVSSLGKTAALGYLPPTFSSTTATTNFVRVGRPVTPDPVAAGKPVVSFYCLLGITDSTNSYKDDFELLVYNQDSKILGGLTFDLSLGYIFIPTVTLDGTTYTNTGFAVEYGTVLEVNFHVNYAANRWSADVGGVQVVNNAVFATRTDTPRNFGSMQARWSIRKPSNPGNNWILADDWTISAGAEPTIPATASASYAANSTAAIAVTDTAAIGWSVSSDQTWAVVSPLTGTGSGTVTVTCAANPNTTPRTATITEGSRTCVLTQAAAPAVTSIPATASTAYSANSIATITVISNTSWNVSSSQTWAVVSPTSGSGNGSVTVTCAANPNAATRTATITVGTQTSTLTQAAAPAVTSIPATASAAYPANSIATITVISNTSWNVSSSQTWAVVSPTSGAGNGSVTVTCALNATAAARTSVITVGTQTCVLTQAASPYAIWAAGLPQDLQGFAQDADHDGVSNGMEYALGRNAANTSGINGIPQLPVITAGGSGAPRHLTMTLSLPEPAPADIVFDVQVANGLTGSWTHIMNKNGAGQWTAPANSAATVVSSPDGSGRTSFVITDTQGYHFMRLAVTSTSVVTPITTVTATASALYTANATATIHVISNSSWTASGNPSWALVSPASGTGNASVTVTCAANVGLARTATITISGQTCVLTQAAAPFALWAATLPAGRQGFYQDSDGDGVSNGIEYALGRSAVSVAGDNGAAQMPVFVWAGSGASRRPALAINLPVTVPVDVTYQVEVSNTLTGSWSAILGKTGDNPWSVIGGSGATVSFAAAGPDRTLHTVTDAQARHFLRLKVTQ